MHRIHFKLAATLFTIAVAAHPLTAAAQSGQRPLDNRSSVERDKYLLGIAQAVKASDHAEALRLIDRLERSGTGVPAPVHYFKAESMLALKRYAEARTASDLYLREGSSARYYEDALKISLAVDRGFDDIKRQWRSELNSLLSTLSTKNRLQASWSGSYEGERFRCKIFSSGLAPRAKIVRGALEIGVDRNDRTENDECRGSDGERWRTVYPGDMVFDDANVESNSQFITIPLHRIGDVRIQEKYARCKGGTNRYGKPILCPSSSSIGRYSSISLDGRTIYLFDSGLSSRFSRVADLYRQLGGDVN